MYEDLDRISRKIQSELQYAEGVRRIRVNPYLYQELSFAIDSLDNNHDIVIIEDPSVDFYEFDY